MDGELKMATIRTPCNTYYYYACRDGLYQVLEETKNTEKYGIACRACIYIVEIPYMYSMRLAIPILKMNREGVVLSKV